MKLIKVIESRQNSHFRITLDGEDQVAPLPFQGIDAIGTTTKAEAYAKAKQIAFDLATWEKDGVKIISEVY